MHILAFTANIGPNSKLTLPELHLIFFIYKSILCIEIATLDKHCVEEGNGGELDPPFFFPKFSSFFASMCSFICLQAVYQLSGHEY